MRTFVYRFMPLRDRVGSTAISRSVVGTDCYFHS